MLRLIYYRKVKKNYLSKIFRMNWIYNRGTLDDRTLEQLSAVIEDAKTGFDPDVLDHWYYKIIERTKEEVPLELVKKIGYVQDPTLLMKFRIDCSKRAVPQLLNAIEHFMPEMQYVTQLYFQKVEEIVEKEYKDFKPDKADKQ